MLQNGSKMYFELFYKAKDLKLFN